MRIARLANNIVVIVLDDVGIEWLPVYAYETQVGIGGGVPPPSVGMPSTPNIDGQIVPNGVVFTTCWGSPWCSPMRATTNTGLYPCEVGIGSRIVTSHSLAIKPLTTLANGLSPAGWVAGAFGKWHMSGAGGSISTDLIAKDIVGTGAGQFRFDQFRGNYIDPFTDPDLGFCQWRRWVADKGLGDPQSPLTSTYVLCQLRNDLRTWIEGRTSDFFVWFGLPHGDRLHRPPEPLDNCDPAGMLCCESGCVAATCCNTCTATGTWPALDLTSTTFPAAQCPGRGPTDGQVLRCYKSLVEAQDAMIGEVLAALDVVSAPQRWYQTTTVIVVGDNGTPMVSETTVEESTNYYWLSESKGTVNEGGIRVPLIIAGKAVTVPGTICAAPVMATDLFKTVHALAAINDPYVARGESLVPCLTGLGLTRSTAGIYTETFSPNFALPGTVRGSATGVWQRAARDASHKVIKKLRKDGPNWPVLQVSYIDYQRDTFGRILEVEVEEITTAHTNLEAMIDGICP